MTATNDNGSIRSPPRRPHGGWGSRRMTAKIMQPGFRSWMYVLKFCP